VIFTRVETEWRNSGRALVRFSRNGEGESLGDLIPGIKVAIAIPAENELLQQAGFRMQVSYVALALVTIATGFGAWLLWRDLRREVRSGELRAQFVSGVSHELKTPLTSIRMFAETLQLGRARDGRTQQEYLDTMVNECERLSRLVDDILSFSKCEQGQKQYHFRTAAIAEVVHAAVRAMEYALKQQGFQVLVSIEEGLPPIRADIDALEQALLNLLSNAMKYSGDSRSIDLDVSRDNNHVVIRVTDHGVGIAQDHQTRLFEKYYRAPTPENQLLPGSGLGLAISFEAVRAHGGRIDVDSSPGRGSTFSIHLPVEDKS
jgi:signal transduction histidine kinase